jgi:uncharacterized protein with HEPN domain
MANNPLASVLDMVQAIEAAQQLSAGLNEAEFMADPRTQWAVYSQFVILGEAASRLPRDFCDRHPDIPWSAAVGMRHRLVHGYDSVDWARVWKTLLNDLPLLLKQLRVLLTDKEGPR